VWDYGAPVSALTFNHGSIRLTLRPGPAVGDPAMLDLSPPLEYFAIANRVRTVAGSSQNLEVERPLGSRLLRLAGAVRAGGSGMSEDIAVDDPALYAAMALADALARRGVAVREGPRARHREAGDPPAAPPGRLLIERTSPPLLELARVVNKISQNLWAELLLRAVAHARTGEGSRKAALDEMKSFLAEIGATPEEYAFQDGSGLSRLTLVTPSTVNRLLRHMYLSPLGEEWKSLLPVGGRDGTLEKRFEKNPAAHAVLAKTGSLSHVNALSGYTESATYGEVSFSIIANDTLAPASEVRAAIDRIALALLE
jgi:D-alanyl-D-alanine carboxypeptidase/D-alanyl-D-alanine-endopeptidase (penicillin-binding protein 4)